MAKRGDVSDSTTSSGLCKHGSAGSLITGAGGCGLEGCPMEEFQCQGPDRLAQSVLTHRTSWPFTCVVTRSSAMWRCTTCGPFPCPVVDPLGPSNQLRAALVGDTRPVANAAVRALFALRWWLGRAFRLDAEHHDPSGASYLHRLTNADRLQSQVSPGTRLGRFRVLYVFDNEGVGEIRNATVHAFLALALTRREPG